jgi:hypothetical protein
MKMNEATSAAEGVIKEMSEDSKLAEDFLAEQVNLE